MKRVILGWILIAHALAHASVAMWILDRGPTAFVTALWTIAIVGYFCVGLAFFRFPWLRDRWKPIMLTATMVSIVTLLWFAPPWGVLGCAIDIVLMLVTLDALQAEIDAEIVAFERESMTRVRQPAALRFEWTVGAIVLVYLAAVALTRPVMLRWGTSAGVRTARLPGDETQTPEANYRIDHAILIHAPAHAVWPWLVQLGQDRAGFYSYDWLERAIGARIYNADSLRADWQTRALGDTVFAAPADYLGGRFGHPGWRVTALEPDSVLGLENWGTFVLQPIDPKTTRLIVRMRAPGSRSFGAFLLAPLNVFVFEPAHFIMERGMLRGIRERAERTSMSGVPPRKNKQLRT